MHKSLLITLIASALLSGCSKPEAEAVIALQPVSTLTLAAPQQLNERVFTGQVAVAELTPLAFRINGKLADVSVLPGQQVTQGQPLARLDDASIRQQWHDANAQHQLLQRNLQRSAPMLQQQLLAQSEFDELSAQARLAKITLDMAAAQLKYSVLRAPFSGVINQVDKEQFETVAAGESVLTIYRNDRIDVEVQLPDTLLLGATALLRDRSYQPLVQSDAHPHPLPMSFLEQSLQLDPNSGAFSARLTADAATALLPGEAVKVRVDMAAAGLPQVKGFHVPLTAIEANGSDGGFRVWRLEQQQVQPLTIAIERIDQHGALISGALAQGQQLISSGLSQLRPNQHVEVVSKESKPQ
ncbi:efflux RND transporter periplasmic adaptor subunit [uncultured Ferrimonas sp.]|uniref:efflux RND transporter periplasmic adaptor subunit n=1 Tax=uncultured Ferrimonas sp. TaxID=432640 RepID=UPI00262B68EF|nr:efflux RND transporter periplasmic adaptor subunit [uncultured Ferrimonas sp.]